MAFALSIVNRRIRTTPFLPVLLLSLFGLAFVSACGVCGHLDPSIKSFSLLNGISGHSRRMLCCLSLILLGPFVLLEIRP